VGGLAVEPRRDAGSVALDLEEVDGVVGQPLEEGAAGRDPEARRGRAQPGDHDPVAARPAQAPKSMRWTARQRSFQPPVRRPTWPPSTVRPPLSTTAYRAPAAGAVASRNACLGSPVA
jgi:hypothetical protein